MNIKNKRAFFEYHIEDKFEAGIVLDGWEVKCIKGGRVNIKESYIKIIKNEVYILGMNVNPTKHINTHNQIDPIRTKKLLLNRKEINKLLGAVNQDGYTIVPIDLHFSNNKVKINIALAKGKNDRDKRNDVKVRDWDREKSRIMKNK